MNKIELTQAPIIRHDLIAIGANVTERLLTLNIEGQIATEETVKSLKTLRSDLNKELAEFEAQRKAVKEAVNSPYNEFETVYKTEISEKYKSAIDTLKDKIAEVEDRIKAEKKANVIEYFAELCAFEQIDWLTFERTGIEINLSTTEKVYKEKVKDFVYKVIDELALIDTNPLKADILVEYKKTLNAAKAIKEVQDRVAAAKAKADRIRFTENNRRSSLLRSLSLVYRDLLKIFEFNADIYVSLDFVENATLEQFNTKVEELKVAIAAWRNENSKPVEAPVPVASAEVAPPLQAPTVEAPAPTPEEFTARFEVKGSREKLLALGQYMRENNINYTNIQ